MITLTSNKRTRFYRRYSTARYAVEQAFKFEPIPGELWTISGPGGAMQFDVLRDHIKRAIAGAEIAVGEGLENHKASQQELRGANTLVMDSPEFISPVRFGFWTVGIVVAACLIAYALAGF